MAELRHPSDATVDSNGPGAKEASSSAFEANALGQSSSASTTMPGSLILNEANAIEHTAYQWSSNKKWAVLTVVALCQTSMSKSHRSRDGPVLECS